MYRQPPKSTVTAHPFPNPTLFLASTRSQPWQLRRRISASTTLTRAGCARALARAAIASRPKAAARPAGPAGGLGADVTVADFTVMGGDRKSTRLNSSH